MFNSNDNDDYVYFNDPEIFYSGKLKFTYNSPP